jgi:hypothetical protein
MKKIVPLAVLGLFTLAGCGQRPDPAPAPAGPQQNAASTLNESTSNTPTGRADTEDPKTQTNSGRPDGPKDLQPGTDGNTHPPGP